MPTARSVRQAAPEAGRWFASAPAEIVLDAGRRATLPLLASCFGKAALYLRPSPRVAPTLSGHMTLSLLGLHPDGDRLGGDLRCEPDALPLADDSVQLVYAAHAAEVVPAPQALLDELARVLAPEGMLVLLVLNPASPYRWRWRGQVPGTASAGEWRQRLGRAGLEPVRRIEAGPWLPWQRRGDGAADRRLDPVAALRAAVSLVARKRRPGMTPLPQRRRPIAVPAAAGPG